jgi:hypothetical protein
MITLPGPRAWKAGFVGRRFRELGQHLGQLSRRVRETVAEAVRETVAQVARDAVDRVLPGRTPDPSEPEAIDDGEEEFDPWADEDEPDPWRQRPGIRTVFTPPEVLPAASAASVARSAVALGLAAAGWWLGRRGSWWGACVIGLVSGTIAAMTRRLTGDGLLLVHAAHEFLTYRQALGDPGSS